MIGEEEYNLFNIHNFIISLTYMWQGMLSVFVVVGIIILATYIMKALFKNKENTSR